MDDSSLNSLIVPSGRHGRGCVTLDVIYDIQCHTPDPFHVFCTGTEGTHTTDLTYQFRYISISGVSQSVCMVGVTVVLDINFGFTMAGHMYIVRYSTAALLESSCGPEARPSTAALLESSCGPEARPSTAALLESSCGPEARPSTAALLESSCGPEARPSTAALLESSVGQRHVLALQHY